MSDPIADMCNKPLSAEQRAKNEQQRAESRQQRRNRLATEAALTLDEISKYSPDADKRPLGAFVGIYCALLIAESAR